MIIERSMHRGWLSNSYLVADQPGGCAVIIDTGAPPEPLLERIAALKVRVTHLLCTHHHHDHVANNRLYRDRLDAAVCVHRKEASLLAEADRLLEDGEILQSGRLQIQVLHIPGHTVGQLAFLIDGQLFTGDTLFRRSVGGTCGPGHGSFEELRHSILDRLLQLPQETIVRPGHTEPSTVAEEWAENPFVRAWRGIDPIVESPCLAFGKPATLLLRARDYDGGTKCWVRFTEGHEEIVPGSRVNDL